MASETASPFCHWETYIASGSPTLSWFYCITTPASDAVFYAATITGIGTAIVWAPFNPASCTLTPSIVIVLLKRHFHGFIHATAAFDVLLKRHFHSFIHATAAFDIQVTAQYRRNSRHRCGRWCLIPRTGRGLRVASSAAEDEETWRSGCPATGATTTSTIHRTTLGIHTSSSYSGIVPSVAIFTSRAVFSRALGIISRIVSNSISSQYTVKKYAYYTVIV